MMNNNNNKKLSIKELRQKARELDVDVSKCLEKQEIVDLIECEEKKREENGGRCCVAPSLSSCCCC